MNLCQLLVPLRLLVYHCTAWQACATHLFSALFGKAAAVKPTVGLDLGGFVS
jgi:hypothetical protein